MKADQLDDLIGSVLPLMTDFGAPYCVAGGWAIDLFVGYATRSHADIELAIFRDDQSRLHSCFRNWSFVKIANGHRQRWCEGERLELPVHEIHARSPTPSALTIEFLLNERDGSDWVFRRNPLIRQPIANAIFTSGSLIPALAPEIAMLFKAKSPREKDEQDFQVARAAMNTSQRKWLADALAICHPDHPWSSVLLSTLA